MASYRPLTDIPISLLSNSSRAATGYVIEARRSDNNALTDLYQDAIGTSAGSSVTLDSRGEPTTIKRIWLDTSVTYKLVFKTDAGVPVWTADPVYGSTASLDQFLQSGTGAVSRSVQAKLRDVVSVKDFGAVGDGVTDDAAAILAAFNAVRTAGGGSVYFPNAGNTVYLVSYGFLVPANCTVFLNGATVKCTTTFGQGSLPTYGGFRAVFACAGSLVNGATLSGYTDNITIYGGGALIDMRYDEQTGTVPGSIGITVETTPAPIVGNEGKVRNVLIKDVTIDQALWYGTYVSGPEHVTFDNVRVTNPANLGHVGVSGRSVTYINCYASGAQERTASQGCGWWNEADSSWQKLENFKYYNCLSEYNRRSGFLWYNDGQDVPVSIYAYGCTARFNAWDGSVQQAGAIEHGHYVNLTKLGTAASHFSIHLDHCSAEDEINGGFHVVRKTGSGSVRQIILTSPIAQRCNNANVDSYYRCPIATSSDGQSDTKFIVQDPVVIAPVNNTIGYGIAALYGEGFFLNDPIYAGTFSSKTIVGTSPTSGRTKMGLDVAYDDKDTGILGDATKWNKPVRLSTWDQSTIPSASTDLYRNELAVWQTDDNQFCFLFRRDDSNFLKYIDSRGDRRIFNSGAYAGATFSAGEVKTGTISTSGVDFPMEVSASYSIDLTANFKLWACVSAANTVRYYIQNLSGSSQSLSAGTIYINCMPVGY